MRTIFAGSSPDPVTIYRLRFPAGPRPKTPAVGPATVVMFLEPPTATTGALNWACAWVCVPVAFAALGWMAKTAFVGA